MTHDGGASGNQCVDLRFDQGRQLERTLLAWRRTCLALAVGNAAAIKYLVDLLGVWVALIGILGLGLSGLAWVLCTVRYKNARSALERGGPLAFDGVLPAIVAVAVAVTATACGVLLVVLWLPTMRG